MTLVGRSDTKFPLLEFVVKTSANPTAANDFYARFKKIIADENLRPEQLYNICL